MRAQPVDDQPEPTPETPALTKAQLREARRIERAKRARIRRERFAHRRGEPRLFVFLWSVYLLVGAAVTILSVRVLGSADARLFRPASTAFLVLLVAGLTVLWPLVRLSQASPRSAVRATIVDLFVLGVLTQAVVAPLKLPTGWRWEVIAGLDVMLLSWTILVGALVLMGSATPPGLGRTCWMISCLLLVGFAPLATLLLHRFGHAAPQWMSLLSPFTAIFELTSAPSGLRVRMSRMEWLCVVAPGALGALAICVSSACLASMPRARSTPG